MLHSIASKDDNSKKRANWGCFKELLRIEAYSKDQANLGGFKAMLERNATPKNKLPSWGSSLVILGSRENSNEQAT